MRKIAALVLYSLEKANKLRRYINQKQAHKDSAAGSYCGKPHGRASNITEEELMKLRKEWHGYNQVI